MLLKNNNFTSKGAHPDKGGQPKADKRLSDGKPLNRFDMNNKRPIAANMGKDSYATVERIKDGIMFRKNQAGRDVKKTLFILEGEDKFDKLSLRSKMTLTVKNGDTSFMDWFYEMGSEDRLPQTWEDFKAEVVKYCTGISLDVQNKFKEERYIAYVERLKFWAESKGYTQENCV